MQDRLGLDLRLLAYRSAAFLFPDPQLPIVKEVCVTYGLWFCASVENPGAALSGLDGLSQFTPEAPSTPMR